MPVESVVMTQRSKQSALKKSSVLNFEYIWKTARILPSREQKKGHHSQKKQRDSRALSVKFMCHDQRKTKPLV